MGDQSRLQARILHRWSFWAVFTNAFGVRALSFKFTTCEHWGLLAEDALEPTLSLPAWLEILWRHRSHAHFTLTLQVEGKLLRTNLVLRPLGAICNESGRSEFRAERIFPMSSTMTSYFITRRVQLGTRLPRDLAVFEGYIIHRCECNYEPRQQCWKSSLIQHTIWKIYTTQIPEQRPNKKVPLEGVNLKIKIEAVILLETNNYATFKAEATVWFLNRSVTEKYFFVLQSS